MQKNRWLLWLLAGCIAYLPGNAQVQWHVNQVGYELTGHKQAVLSAPIEDVVPAQFAVVNTANNKTMYTGHLQPGDTLFSWMPGTRIYRADFSSFTQPGHYRLSIRVNGRTDTSFAFAIGQQLLAHAAVPAIAHYYRKQRANTPQELDADKQLLLFGTQTTVNMQGGWCDASGDVSKYFSHLAYANFMSPQQTPLVTWSLARAAELPQQPGITDSLTDEALWGADYMMRALSDSGYFRMVVFSYFNKDPRARRVVGLEANSVTTQAWQCAFREGGGVAIAALARISRWHKHGDYTQQQYLAAACRAFAHLQLYNTRYDDDGKENIIDDYCALLAATELWISTNDTRYATAARMRARKLAARLSPGGYFIADDGSRPYWHASDAGLPVVALVRYLHKETDTTLRRLATNTIAAALLGEWKLTQAAVNPFGYARQTFSVHGRLQTGFFIPHVNETGWWWQGENARLASLATAAIDGAFTLPPAMQDSLRAFAAAQLNWILGSNPYNRCFLYGFGKNNVPYMHSNYGHGSAYGGISNGITGKSGNDDGSGIEFNTTDESNEWRWTEQWIPHAAWFLQAVVADGKHD